MFWGMTRKELEEIRLNPHDEEFENKRQTRRGVSSVHSTCLPNPESTFAWQKLVR